MSDSVHLDVTPIKDTVQNQPNSDEEMESDSDGAPNEDSTVQNEPVSNRGRGRTAEVWSYFTTYYVMVNDKKVEKARCKNCPKVFTIPSSGCTSTIKRHIEKRCLRTMQIRNAGKRGKSFFGNKTMGNSNITVPSGPFDAGKSRELLAKMIIAHELPFSFVEYQGFNIYMKYNNPLHEKISRNTIKKECIRIFELEKEKIKNIFKGVDRISLTSDCWTSNQTISYMVITAHYVDADWVLRKRIISFNELAPPHSGEVIYESIVDSLMKWGIENKIGTITLDNASNNDRAASLLQSNFEGREKLHFKGFFFHVRCCAHILNLVVQEGLKEISGYITDIREGVKYLRKSPSRLLRFGEIALQLGVSTHRSLCSDVKTRWNSTYRMIQSAIHFKKAFKGYALRDTSFIWCPSEDKWCDAEKVLKLLEVFSKATTVFSGSLYPTTNLFLEQIFLVKMTIDGAYANHSFMHAMTTEMYKKFDKYWGEINVLMAMASVLDPRFKFTMINYCFEKLFPVDYTDRIVDVRDKLKTLFGSYEIDYISKTSNVASSSSSSSLSCVTTGSSKSHMDEFYANRSKNVLTRKSDLEIYLDEPELPDSDKFLMLDWWKVNSEKFPVLSNMARDILTIPVSTVASESAFSARGRVLDDYRSSLTTDMAEILVCGGDWIRAEMNANSQTLEDTINKEENLNIEIPKNVTTTS